MGWLKKWKHILLEVFEYLKTKKLVTPPIDKQNVVFVIMWTLIFNLVFVFFFIFTDIVVGTCKKFHLFMTNENRNKWNIFESLYNLHNWCIISVVVLSLQQYNSNTILHVWNIYWINHIVHACRFIIELL